VEARQRPGAADPTFAGLTLSGGTASTLAYLNASKKFTSLANGAGYLLNDGSGGLSWAAVSLSGYLKADGTVPLTADWNAGVFDLTIGSITSTATAANEATTGDTLISNGNFATNDLTGWTAAAGWSAATGKAVHSAGDTTALVQAVSVTNGSTYQVAVTTSGRSAGTLTVQMGALVEAYDVYLNDTYYKTFTATATASINLIFTPNTDFNGAVDDVSVKLVSPNATPHFALNDSTATLTAEVRSNAALKNLGIGIFALRYNTTGHENTAIGYHAGQSITNGFYNVVLGAEALSQATTGHRNTAIGYGAFQLTTTGKAGTAVGAYALQQNTTGN
jgi:trimeric autotransporter adhesin